MAINADKFVDEYRSLEVSRKARNRWIYIGFGGAAIGGAFGVLTGNYDIGGTIAALSALGTIPQVLDATDAVNDDRRSITYLIQTHEPEQPAPQPLLPANQLGNFVHFPD